MDSANRDLYNQKITELLHDEEKIITCTSLASTLEVSIHDAKTLLKDYIQDLETVNRKDFHVTFILSGHLKDSKGLAVYLVKEEDLEEKRMLFNTFHTELIYSIQKSKNLDLNIITLVDKNNMESINNLRGSIVSKKCIRRNIQKHKVTQVTKTEQEKEAASFFKKVTNVTNSPKTSTQQSSQDHPSQEKHPKAKQTQKQSSGIANYFTKASVTTKSSGSSQHESKDVKLNGNTSLNSKNEETITTQTKVNCEEKSNVKKEHPENEKMEVESVNVSSDPSQTKSSSKKRKKTSKVDNSANKKRKRIQEMCDSDSSDIFDSEKDEDIIEQSDEEPEPAPVVEPPVPTKKRVRKAIDEVHMDEEGFLVTTTKYIYESASDNDEEKTVKPTTEQKPKVLTEKKNGSANLENGTKKKQGKGTNNKKVVSGKQTTLMNFFKRN